MTDELLKKWDECDIKATETSLEQVKAYHTSVLASDCTAAYGMSIFGKRQIESWQKSLDLNSINKISEELEKVRAEQRQMNQVSRYIFQRKAAGETDIANKEADVVFDEMQAYEKKRQKKIQEKMLENQKSLNNKTLEELTV